MAFSINEQTRKEANLRLLQRSSDPLISNILGSATHVVLYQFEQTTQSWQKSNVEGSLFLAVKQQQQQQAAAAAAAAAEYSLVILNRNSPTNFSINIEYDFQLQHKDPYLIFKQQLSSSNLQQQQQSTTAIRGIWFPNPQERIQMNDLLIQVIQTLKNQPQQQQQQQLQQQQPPPQPSSSFPISSNNTNTMKNPSPDPVAATAALLSPLSLGAILDNNNNNNNNPSTTITNTTTTNNNHSSSAATAAAAQQVNFSIFNDININSKPSNLLPRSTSANSSSSSQRQPSPSQQQNTPMLDKKSLQLALLSLIQDERFLDLLHAQYLKVAHARANRNNNNNNNNNNN